MKTGWLPVVLVVFCYLMKDEVRSVLTEKALRPNYDKHRTSTVKVYEKFRRNLQTKASEVAQGLREINWKKVKNTYKRISRIVIPTPMASYRMSNSEYYKNKERLLGSNAKIKDIISNFLQKCLYRLLKITFDVFIDKIHKIIVQETDDDIRDYRKKNKKKRTYEYSSY